MGLTEFSNDHTISLNTSEMVYWWLIFREEMKLPEASWVPYHIEIVYSTDNYMKARENRSLQCESEKDLQRGDRSRRLSKRYHEIEPGLISKRKHVAAFPIQQSLPKPPRPISFSNYKNPYAEERSNATSKPCSPAPCSSPSPQLSPVASLPEIQQRAEQITEGITLPLRTLEDISSLETQLEDKTCRQELVLYLGTIGGIDIQTSTRRVMATIFTNELAIKLNWVGHGGKMAFQSLKLSQVLCDAVRRGGINPVPQDSVIENMAKLWLHNARDRSGGRKERLARSLGQSQAQNQF
ncbi:hypothetical protein MATL_G00209380 [Megalops atlanticus]|uniref:DUF4806 domain-containing protein n=1 Tax=Megalops atlanticus TaxID=7932 RepID=A0A9D3PJ49_MEGAT|nr:hypothetical protein MATL_G00209380 [Megalops atlanticus]